PTLFRSFRRDQIAPSTEPVYLTLSSFRTRLNSTSRNDHSSRTRGATRKRGGSDVRSVVLTVAAIGGSSRARTGRTRRSARVKKESPSGPRSGTGDSLV